MLTNQLVELLGKYNTHFHSVKILVTNIWEDHSQENENSFFCTFPGSLLMHHTMLARFWKD